MAIVTVLFGGRIATIAAIVALVATDLGILGAVEVYFGTTATYLPSLAVLLLVKHWLCSPRV